MLGAGGAAAPRLPPGGVSRGGGERFVLKMPAELWVAGRAGDGRQEAMPLLRAFSESALHAKELPFGVFWHLAFLRGRVSSPSAHAAL